VTPPAARLKKLRKGQVMSIVREVSSIDGQAAVKMAALQEVTDPKDGKLWLYYTVGADLGPKLDLYQQKGWTLGDPQITGLYAVGFPIHRREVVIRDKGPSADQALADADGENEFPRFMADAPVCYTRQADGQEWLVYSRGPHMKEALDELWRKGKAIVRLEVPCTDENGAPLLFKGKRCYRRLVVKSDNKYALKPDQVT
jgi:hypothetical protein